VKQNEQRPNPRHPNLPNMRHYRHRLRWATILLRPLHSLFPKHRRSCRRPLLAHRNPSHRSIRSINGRRRMDRLGTGNHTNAKTNRRNHKRNQARRRQKGPRNIIFAGNKVSTVNLPEANAGDRSTPKVKYKLINSTPTL